jgi:peptide chain release factor 3
MVLLGAAGPLQFEVVQYRLQSEYGATTRLVAAPWNEARWLEPGQETERINFTHGAQRAQDGWGGQAVLFDSAWSVRYFAEKNPDVRLSTMPVRS